MKVLFYLLFGLTLFSCKKNYTCQCSTLDPNYGFVNPTEYQVRERKELDVMEACVNKFVESGKATNGINCQVSQN